jgi:hypothetical protein
MKAWMKWMGVPTVMLTAGLAFGDEAPGTAMQVEEPGFSQNPPVNPERESVSWQVKTKPRTLTEEQRIAMEERRNRVQAMVEELKEKRKALDEASPEEKAERARELHAFIMEKTEGGDVAERMRQMQQERREKLMEMLKEKQHRGQGKGTSGKGEEE